MHRRRSIRKERKEIKENIEEEKRKIDLELTKTCSLDTKPTTTPKKRKKRAKSEEPIQNIREEELIQPELQVKLIRPKRNSVMFGGDIAAFIRNENQPKPVIPNREIFIEKYKITPKSLFSQKLEKIPESKNKSCKVKRELFRNMSKTLPSWLSVSTAAEDPIESMEPMDHIFDVPEKINNNENNENNENKMNNMNNMNNENENNSTEEFIAPKPSKKYFFDKMFERKEQREKGADATGKFLHLQERKTKSIKDVKLNPAIKIDLNSCNIVERLFMRKKKEKSLFYKEYKSKVRAGELIPEGGIYTVTEDSDEEGEEYIFTAGDLTVDIDEDIIIPECRASFLS